MQRIEYSVRTRRNRTNRPNPLFWLALRTFPTMMFTITDTTEERMKLRLTTLLAIAASLAFTSAARAHGDDERGHIPLPDEGVLTMPALSQSAFSKAGAALSSFAARNTDWQFRMNARTGTPHRAWGAGIQIDGFHNITLPSAPMAGARFLETHADVLGVDPASVRLMYAEIANNTVYLKYVQQHEGLDVLHAEIDLRATPGGRVFLFGSDARAGISVNTTPTLSQEAARRFATAGLEGDPATFEFEDGSLAILPLNYPTQTAYHLVRQVTVRTDAQHMWETYVDAHAGTVLWRRNLVHHFTQRNGGPDGTAAVVNGRVMITIYPQSWLTGAATVPMPNAHVSVGGKMYTTDADGRFTADIGASADAPVVARLTGPFARARRADTTTNGTVKNAVFTATATAGQDIEILWNDNNSVASERNLFYHLTRVRNWIRSIDPSGTLADLDRQMIGVVNIADECNANWNGTTVNFFAQSASCGNTAEISDVIYHEFGHALNTFSYRKLKNTSMRNGALSEGTADINANMLIDDPRIGIGFMKGGPDQGIIRNSDNSLRYPENIVNQIHTDGMIIAGAVWDVRKAIGLERTAHLAHYAKYGTPDGTATGEAFADYFLEFLVADDDDGNLANGTPNSAAIVPAFMRHGIPASGITVTHTALADQSDAATGYPMNGTVSLALSLNTSLISIQEVRVVYSIDNWQTSASVPVAYNAQTKAISGNFPQQPAGSIVRYYIEAVDNFGSVARSPLQAPASNYLFLVGFTSKEYHDAEAQDGWTVTGDVVTGNWIRAVPVGTYNSALGTPPSVPYVQPNSDHTPGSLKTVCWVTGNGTSPGQLGEADVDDGTTYLTTRSYDISAMKNPVLRYYRWYSNDAGATPGTDSWIVRVSSDAGATWKVLEDTKVSDASWKPIVTRLRDVVELTDKFRVVFEASDLGEGSLVEAAVDDFEILDSEAVTSVAQVDALPGAFVLAQNFPNPFNPTTTLRYTLPGTGSVRMRIIDAVGQVVAEPVHAQQGAGTYSVVFDAASLPSGLYHAVLEFDGRRLTRSMTLLK